MHHSFIFSLNRRKQGAYGKIKTHKESKVAQLMHIDEVFSAVSLLYVSPLKSNLENDYVKKTFNADDLAFCDEILCKVSRSFAAVIRQLPPTLLVDVLIFYLVLRALDTIEDDMTSFEDNDVKVKHLMSFHKTALVDPNWSMDGVGEADEKLLLQEQSRVDGERRDKFQNGRLEKTMAMVAEKDELIREKEVEIDELRVS